AVTVTQVRDGVRTPKPDVIVTARGIYRSTVRVHHVNGEVAGLVHPASVPVNEHGACRAEGRRAARVGPGEGDVVLPVTTQDGDVPAERGGRGVGEVDAGHLVPRPADDAHPEGPARGRYARAAVGEARTTEIGPDGVLAGAPEDVDVEQA